MSKQTRSGAQAMLRVLSAAMLALLLTAGINARAARPRNAASVIANEITCGDFLGQSNKKPPALEFVRCEKILQYGTPALVAHYRVAGINAAAVETSLIKSARMPRLRFLCCGWESAPISPKSHARTGVYAVHGQRFEVTMTSGESTVHKRQRWAEIPYFTVKITVYTELP
jgi:hypothetical protein